MHGLQGTIRILLSNEEIQEVVSELGFLQTGSKREWMTE